MEQKFDKIYEAYSYMVGSLSKITDLNDVSLVEHSKAVAQKVNEKNMYCDDADDYIIVALLHDVLENDLPPHYVEVERDWIKNHFGEEIFEAVSAITKNKWEKYEEYIERCSKNKIACFVKLCDLEHNMDITRWGSWFNKDSIGRWQKYRDAYYRLSIVNEIHLGNLLSNSDE
jgi:(p)ppGpp synthase/HD superfamily hydrolase